MAIGCFAVSIAFGALAVAYGLTPEVALLISVRNLTCAGQLAGRGLIYAKKRSAALHSLFLEYIPHALPGAMSFPGVLSSTDNMSASAAARYCGNMLAPAILATMTVALVSFVI